MAATTTFSLLLLLLTFSLFTPLSSSYPSSYDISLRDLESAIFALRSNGFNLFANSIAVSDLSFQILSGHNSGVDIIVHGGDEVIASGAGGGFTFLAPPNSALFSLDMSTDAFTYVHSLRFHVVPRRLSASDLRNVSLSSSPYLPTLVPGHFLHVSVSGGGHGHVSVDGVRVSFPDLYLRSGSGIAAHGLDGILASSSTEEFFHGLTSSSISSPPSFSPYSDLIPASSPEIEGMPVSSPYSDVIPASSPEIEGTPASSPELDDRFSISAPETSVCGDWIGCDLDDFLSPVTTTGSISLPPATDSPANELESPESSESSERKRGMMNKKPHEGDDEYEGQGDVHIHTSTNFAKYSRDSLL